MKPQIFLLIAIVVTFTIGCNDEFLEVSPKNELSSASFWKDEGEANKASVAVYDSWTSLGYSIYLSNSWSDDAIATSFWTGYSYNVLGLGNIPSNNGDLNNFWSNCYAIIRRSNVFLENIAKPTMDETKRKQLAAEVKFIRAFAYHMLYYNFGEVILTDKPLVADITSLKLSRANTGETIAFILKDLDEAIQDLSETATEKGRITKGAALSFKARTLLYELKWSEAAETAKKVMASKAYELFQTSTKDGYREQFAEENNNNKEQILTWQYNNSGSVLRLNDKPSLLGPGGQLSVVSVSLAEAYLNRDGTTYDAINTPAGGLYDADKRDPRFAYTVGFNKAVTPATYTSIVKFSAGKNPANQAATNAFIRYAEVLLIYAEAKVEANAIDQSVLDAINEVRARAYGDSLTGTTYPKVTTTTQKDLRDIVRNERRVELAMEGLRWYDLKRWGTIETAMIGKGEQALTGANVSRSLSKKDYVRPIPQAQIDLEGADVLQQNPGY